MSVYVCVCACASVCVCECLFARVGVCVCTESGELYVAVLVAWPYVCVRACVRGTRVRERVHWLRVRARTRACVQ